MPNITLHRTAHPLRVLAAGERGVGLWRPRMRIVLKERAGQMNVCGPSFKALVVLISAASFASDTAIGATLIYTDEASFQAAYPDVDVADFDTASDGAPISTDTQIDSQYAADGILINSFNAGTPRASSAATSLSPAAISQPNYLVTGDPPFSGGGGFEVVLTAGARAIGLWIGDLQDLGGDTRLELYSSSDASIASLDLVDELGNRPLEWRFLGVGSTDASIGRFTVSISSSDSVLFDTLSVAPVPLPGAVWFLVGGLAAVAAFRRASPILQ